MRRPVEQEMDAEIADRVEQAIWDGIKQGEHLNKAFRKQRRKRLASVITASVLLFACLFTIRVSPVFAAMVSDIPGLQKFVKLINHSYDKGVRLALDNKLVQPVGVSEEHEGMKLTVQGIMADEARMIVFFDVQIPNTDESVQIKNTSLSDASGKALVAMSSYNFLDEQNEGIHKADVQHKTVDFQLLEGESFPDEVKLNIELTGASVNKTKFNVTFPIDKSRFSEMKQEYVLKKTIEMEGQKITFAKAVISPLRISLYVDYDLNNSMQIFWPGDIRLVDDKGNVWNQTTGSMGKNHQVFQFESPYYEEPKSLTVEGSWFRALDKAKTSVVMDTEKGKLLQAPDEKIKLNTMSSMNTYMELDFAIKGIDLEDHMMYTLFDSEFTDATGKRYKTADNDKLMSTYVETSKPGEQHSMFYLDHQAYKQPLTFTIMNYPSYIRSPYKVNIK
ncbi:DUF4179 domain-containing protein [Paenibacillus pini]|uniref:DUF4179 domain-containing protein n=1 Tax=Paenibacillus pini JCM 16418 TaxID=1236976 RepID=W7YG12_9BACL|nr:DUF4179 domain-containing protein [Paenibacillus pini]GAF09865.1 hypothetical protein JCM16418_4025 [Paenibacillus pini JCM 16418]